MVERLLQRLGLHDIGMFFTAMREGPDSLLQSLLVDMHDQIEPQVMGHTIAKGDHLTKLPGRIDMEERKRRLARMKGFHGQVQHDG